MKDTRRHVGSLQGAALALLCSITFACAHERVPFTRTLWHQAHLTNQRAAELQYWTHGDLVIERTLTEASAEITGRHEILFRDGRRIERVVLEDGTPGIVVQALPSGLLHVSFESGTYFEFLTSADVRVYEEDSQRFWYCLVVYGNNTVQYSDFRYDLVSGSPCLLVQKDRVSLRQESTRTLPGVTLPRSNNER